MVEYAVLIGGVVIAIMIALPMIGGALEAELANVNAGFGTAAIDADEGAIEDPRGCPNGWNLIPNNSTKKKGQNVDANLDGLICQKDIPGKGKGNTNLNTNVKDNNNP